MTELHLTTGQLADKAGVHPATVRRLIRGDGWPQERTREAVITALGMPHGAFGRSAIQRPPADYSTTELARELCDLARELCERLTGT